jgi:hypothetical protein
VSVVADSAGVLEDAEPEIRSMPLATAAREMFPSCRASWPWR